MPLFKIVLYAASLLTLSYGYAEFGAITLPLEPFAQSTPRPHQLPRDDDLRYEAFPSMITAIAPSTTLASNGSLSTMYSLHYHDFFVRSRVGKGVFNRRGVFASDPPIATCTPCGNATSMASSVVSTSSSCTTRTYTGVFRSPVSASTSTDYCYASNYTGVFKPSTITTQGLPCCFTIPASCLANFSSPSYTYSSGVFRPTSTSTYISDVTSSSSSSYSASPSSSSSLMTVSSTSGSSSSSTTSSGSIIIAFTSSTSISASSSIPNSASGSTSGFASSSTSVVEITSTTVTVSSSRPGSSDPSTVTVITIVPSTQSTPITITTVIPNTIYGCGTASGSGIITGTGTVYIGPGGLIPVVSSGSASGFASKVVGCGTVTATTGSFTGSGIIIGCGTGSGTATMTGTGTVWPAYPQWAISFVSSGILTGSGRVVGCGTLTGSGTFSATQGMKIITTVSPTPIKTTIEVYLSYCPTSINVLPRIGGNSTSPPSSFTLVNSTGNVGSANSSICNVCSQQAGICCPPGIQCTENGQCPWVALKNAGYVFNGYNLVEMRNSSGPAVVRRGNNHVKQPYV